MRSKYINTVETAIRKRKRERRGHCCEALYCENIPGIDSPCQGDHLVRRNDRVDYAGDIRNIRVTCGCVNLDYRNGRKTTKSERLQLILDHFGYRDYRIARFLMRRIK